jgi:Ca2+/H+ antiporter, TMEM165/GDT1 family
LFQTDCNCPIYNLATSAHFVATLLAFFLIEMGDKTQIATMALAARYDAFWAVVAGTTFGMMIANVPAVIVGDRVAHRLPIHLIRRMAAALFVLMGISTLVGGGASAA